jgi:hypothetical protein
MQCSSRRWLQHHVHYGRRSKQAARMVADGPAEACRALAPGSCVTAHIVAILGTPACTHHYSTTACTHHYSTTACTHHYSTTACTHH